MLKLSLLVSAAVVAGAATFNLPEAPAQLFACEVNSRSEAIVWAKQHPTVGYVAACQGPGGR